MREIAQRIVADLGIDERADDGERQRGDDEVVAVGLGIGDGLHADYAAGAGARLDEELLLEHAGEVIGDDAGKNVGGAARREGIDDAHRTRRPFVRRRGGCGENPGKDEQRCAMPFHFVS
jgi:hypothetical protein